MCHCSCPNFQCTYFGDTFLFVLSSLSSKGLWSILVSVPDTENMFGQRLSLAVVVVWQKYKFKLNELSKNFSSNRGWKSS